MAESWEEKLQIFENLLSFFFFFSPRFLSNNGQNRNWARWSGENSVLTSSSLFFSAKKREKFLIPSSRVRTYLARKKKQDRHPVPSSRSVHATTGYYHFKIRDWADFVNIAHFSHSFGLLGVNDKWSLLEDISTVLRRAIIGRKRTGNKTLLSINIARKLKNRCKLQKFLLIETISANKNCR